MVCILALQWPPLNLLFVQFSIIIIVAYNYNYVRVGKHGYDKSKRIEMPPTPMLVFKFTCNCCSYTCV